MSFRFRLAQKICRWLPPLVASTIRNLIYPLALARIDNMTVNVKSQSGSLFVCQTNDFHGYPFSIHGYYEWRIWAIASVICKQGDCIIEIGANVGTETVGFSDIVAENGQVHGFEPLPQNYATLIEALKFAKHKNTIFYPLAVAEECKTIFFSVPPSNMSGMGYITYHAPTKSEDQIAVKCINLDSLIGKFAALKAIFIDAEGCEYAILCGAHQLLMNYRPYLLLEASPKLLKRAGVSLNDLHSELKKLNYVAYTVGRLGLRKVVDVSRTVSSANWFCLPNKNLEIVKQVNFQLFIAGILPCISNINPICLSSKE